MLNMSTTMISTSAVFPFALVLALAAGCSGTEQAVPDRSTTGTAAPDAGSATAGRAPATPRAPGGDCDLLSEAEIAEAFGGALTVTRSSGHGERGAGCTVSIAEGEDGQLVFQAGNRAAFEARKQAYQSQSRIRAETLDVGEEAYLFNGAQVIAIDTRGQSISIGLTLFVVGGPMPIADQAVAAGLEDLAKRALDRI
jgi:hypothetical protein